MSKIGRTISRGWIGWTIFALLLVSTYCLGYWRGQEMQLSKDSASQLGSPVPTQSIAGHPLPSVPSTVSPSSVTPEIAEYRQNQAKLAEGFAQLRGTNGAPANPQAYAKFRQQNAALFQRQQQLTQQVMQQRARGPLAEPPPLNIPPNATPQLKAFLTERDQMQRDQIAFINQHKNDDPAARQVAMQQWRQQNTGRIQQLQEMSRALTQSISPPPASNSTVVHP